MITQTNNSSKPAVQSQPVGTPVPADESPSAVKENILQGGVRESMAYTNDLTEKDVEDIIERHAKMIRTGFRNKEVSAKWLAHVLLRSNKTISSRYERGTPVSEIVKAELVEETDKLKESLMQLTPEARERLIAELNGKG